MGNHKRRRPKNRRAGHRMYKLHKGNGYKGSFQHQTWQEKKARVKERLEPQQDPSAVVSLHGSRF